MSPLEKLRRPATGTSHRRHSSLVDSESQKSVSPSRSGRSHRKIGSLQRLSLSLSNNEYNIFGNLLTQEPEELLGGQDPRKQSLNEDGAGAGEPSTARFRGRSSPVLEETAEDERPARRSSQKRQQRFSLLKFRHASDPQLSTKYKNTSNATNESVPPQIIMTAPTTHHQEEPVKRKAKTMLGRSLSPFRRTTISRKQDFMGDPTLAPPLSTARPSHSTPDLREQTIQFEDATDKPSRVAPLSPPAYGDESTSSLAIPISRLSESGGSEGSSGSHKVYAQTTTTHTISTTTTFFKMKRKKKDKGPLFPLPEKFERPTSQRANTTQTMSSGVPRRSISPRRSMQAVRFEPLDGDELTTMPSPTHSLTALTNAPLGSPGPAIVRKLSTLSNRSRASSPAASLIPPRPRVRGRSSTLGSIGKASDKGDSGLQVPEGRDSTSTNGRRSFGDLLMFSHRLRQNSGPPRHGQGNSPSTPGSKPNSMQLTREAEPEIQVPARDETDTPASYLEKLEAAVARGQLATILCKSSDEFSKTCLRKYMRGFSYFQESIDMSIRKMLMEVELPKETQQIDRLLAAFADRYHECNPGIFKNVDEASIIAFSILLLHSDTHNKNNKRKMQKQDYVKNTKHGQVNISGDILECFYDNICYTPFIHLEDDIAINGHRLPPPKSKKSLKRSKSTDSLRGPVDPYTLILENKLDLLRPSLKDVMDTEDTYSSTGTLKNSNSNEYHSAFMHSSVLQIVSARSRPDAFMHQATISNPAEAQAGLVSIKIAKVGLLWRKDPKKKKAKRAWQEWGAVLTDSKLYFFKDVGWIKKLMTQYETHQKTASGKSGPLLFKPPLTSFEPDAYMVMDDAVTIMDSSYKKHKNAFTFIKQGGFEEIFLANSEGEMNDWIGKLNYASTFRTVGIRMRGLLGTNYEGRRLFRRPSTASALSMERQIDQTAAARKVDSENTWEILFYRHQLIQEKISGFEDKLTAIRLELDHLLRDARHLMILLPVQEKTREAIVLAAGRMSAKLKWTRVEMWRTQTHADILKKDLEAEGNVSTFPIPRRDSIASLPKKSTAAADPSSLGKEQSNTDDASPPQTPTASTSARRPSQIILDQIKLPDSVLGTRSESFTPLPGPVIVEDEQSATQQSLSESRALQQTSPVVNAIRKGPDGGVIVVINSADEKSSTIQSLDGEISPSREGLDRGSDAGTDRVSAISPTFEEPPRERGSGVRRSLQRTLRDTSGSSHQSPSYHRRKGKESGSSNALSLDEPRLVINTETAELKRGTGSFILHGKKASVITMSPEWAAMTSEERMKRRTTDEPASKENRPDDSLAVKTTDNIADGDASGLSAISSPVREDFVSATSSRRVSVSTANEEPGSDTLITSHDD